MPGLKLRNEYIDNFPGYDKIPKAVLGAIVRSLACQIDPDNWQEEFYQEWEALFTNRIIPQKPIRF